MKTLCDSVRAILMEESNIQPVSSPVTICGDVHGQFWDVLELLRKGGDVPQTSYIFMARMCLLELHSGDSQRSSRATLSTAAITVWKPSRCFLCLRQGVGRSHSRACTVFQSSHESTHVRYPDKVTLLRGNHESRQITQVYGFYGEST